MMERYSGQLQVLKMWQIFVIDQSGVTGGGFDPYNVHALFVNMDNMWMERFGNYDCLVTTSCNTCTAQNKWEFK